MYLFEKFWIPCCSWNMANKWYGVAADVAYPFSLQGSKFCEALVSPILSRFPFAGSEVHSGCSSSLTRLLLGLHILHQNFWTWILLHIILSGKSFKHRQMYLEMLHNSWWSSFRRLWERAVTWATQKRRYQHFFSLGLVDVFVDSTIMHSINLGINSVYRFILEIFSLKLSVEECLCLCLFI